MKKKISWSAFQELEKNPKFRFKLAHTSRLQEGVIVSQIPGVKHSTITVASGIHPKLLQSVQQAHEWATIHGYKDDEKWGKALRCNFLSFLLENKAANLKSLLDFLDLQSPPKTIQSVSQKLKKWLKKKLSN